MSIIYCNDGEKQEAELVSRALSTSEESGRFSTSNFTQNNRLQSIRHVVSKRAATADQEIEHGTAARAPSPQMLRAAHELVEQARCAWVELDSSVAFCEVPASDAGLIALEKLISEGISVRVTSLFGLRRYRQVLNAYITGMEARLSRAKPLGNVASIASLSVNTIDALAQPILERLISCDSEPADLAEEVQGRIANAISTMAHQINREVFRSERFQKLAKLGARGQTLFVNCDHCGPLSLASEDVAAAQRVLDCLPLLGIDIEAIAHQLERSGSDNAVACSCPSGEGLDYSAPITSRAQISTGLHA